MAGAKGARAVARSKSAGYKASHGTSSHLTNEQFLAHLHGTLPSVGPQGRFYDNKVFIDAAHEAFVRTPQGKGISLEAFKERLVELNTARKINLSRADMVGAMDLGRVRRSETAYLNATFHFILIK